MPSEERSEAPGVWENFLSAASNAMFPLKFRPHPKSDSKVVKVRGTELASWMKPDQARSPSSCLPEGTWPIRNGLATGFAGDIFPAFL